MSIGISVRALLMVIGLFLIGNRAMAMEAHLKKNNSLVNLVLRMVGLHEEKAVSRLPEWQRAAFVQMSAPKRTQPELATSRIDIDPEKVNAFLRDYSVKHIDMFIKTAQGRGFIGDRVGEDELLAVQVCEYAKNNLALLVQTADGVLFLNYLMHADVDFADIVKDYAENNLDALAYTAAGKLLLIIFMLNDRAFTQKVNAYALGNLVSLLDSVEGRILVYDLRAQDSAFAGSVTRYVTENRATLEASGEGQAALLGLGLIDRDFHANEISMG